jgi:hypothetical protein
MVSSYRFLRIIWAIRRNAFSEFRNSRLACFVRSCSGSDVVAGKVGEEPVLSGLT